MEHYKDKILPILKKYFPRAKIYLFGSRAQGRFRSGSDIDIAIDVGKQLDILSFAVLRSKLEDLNIPVNLDLVDFHAMPQAMQEEILKDGIVWKL